MMEKRTLLAIILSIAVLLIYQGIVGKFYRKPAVKTETAQMVSARKEEWAKPAMSPAQKPQPLQELQPDREIGETTISGSGLSLRLSSEGATIKEILLKNKEHFKKDEAFFLIKQEEARFAPLAFWFGAEPQATAQLKYKMTEEDGKVNFSADIAKQLRLHKKVSFTKSKYGIELELIFDNFSDQDKEVKYLIVAASGINQSNKMDKRFSGIESKVDGTILWENLRNLRKTENWIEHSGITNWTALRNTHYEVVLRPESPGSAAASVARSVDKDNLACGLKADTFVVPANSSISHKYLLYAGPADYKHLTVYNLQDTIYFGKLNFICKFLLKSLHFFYSITHNYGVAIIILTLAIGVILFPLTLKNFRSMRQMQVIQPHISKLRELHKDDPHKLQRETMQLYRKYKVNPLGGCLPMFLQMPIFISLYITLMRSVELKGAHFLWIKDLSEPDAVANLPLKLPFLGDKLNLLPLLMIGAMIAQQKMSSYKRAKADPQTEQQQKMMLMMPLVFGIIFYSLPSGLVLYWLTNTIFMTLVQFHIARTMPAVETVAG